MRKNLRLRCYGGYTPIYKTKSFFIFIYIWVYMGQRYQRNSVTGGPIGGGVCRAVRAYARGKELFMQPISAGIARVRTRERGLRRSTRACTRATSPNNGT